MKFKNGMTLLLPLVGLALAQNSGCSATNSELTTSSSSSGTGAGGEGGSPGTGGSMGIGGINLSGGGDGTGGGPQPCTPGPDEDFDKDGFSINEGDCDDCEPNVGPNAVEVVTEPGGDPIDEDCDLEIDEEDIYIPCDSGIAIDEMSAGEAVKATDICKISSGPKDWGLVQADWVLPDGSPATNVQPGFHLGHGVLPQFGTIVQNRQGEAMLVLSSGTARQPNDPGYQDVGGFDKGYTSAHPVGFPKESPACPGVTTGQPHDGTGIKVVLRAPQNAYGVSFDFDFYTYEWPGYVCSTYNDFFVALLTPFPQNQTDGNISFDSMGNPVSVNNAFVDVCGCDGNPPSPCFAGGKTFTCPLGNTELLGTGFGFDYGFEDHAATSWLQTTAPIEPSSDITLVWATYDSGDGVLDSTTLIDNFRWIAKPGVDVGTTPVPN
ncbi:MAG: hypothetical protein KC731_03455 [Myxococcales bacterium]|nr:hypothetical protein [Myxococcales bacterium]